jgi:hypothetical protein
MAEEIVDLRSTTNKHDELLDKVFPAEALEGKDTHDRRQIVEAFSDVVPPLGSVEYARMIQRAWDNRTPQEIADYEASLRQQGAPAAEENAAQFQADIDAIDPRRTQD